MPGCGLKMEIPAEGLAGFFGFKDKVMRSDYLRRMRAKTLDGAAAAEAEQGKEGEGFLSSIAGAFNLTSKFAYHLDHRVLVLRMGNLWSVHHPLRTLSPCLVENDVQRGSTTFLQEWPARHGRHGCLGVMAFVGMACRLVASRTFRAMSWGVSFVCSPPRNQVRGKDHTIERQGRKLRCRVR